eukprot:scaffold932_cov139-Skeletonema_menzelii.AAC.16
MKDPFYERNGTKWKDFLREDIMRTPSQAGNKEILFEKGLFEEASQMSRFLPNCILFKTWDLVGAVSLSELTFER